jgi:hypothetical protein
LGNSYLPAFKAVVKTLVAFNGKFIEYIYSRLIILFLVNILC